MKASALTTGAAAILFGLVSALALTPVGAQQSADDRDEVTLNADHPDEYVVQEGDTLWDISGRFLEEPWQWPRIWEANPEIDNPDLIFPGDRLRLVYRDGDPRVVLERGDRRVVRLSPQVRESPLNSAIDAIPRSVIDNFLVQNRVVPVERYRNAPYLVSSTDDNLMIGAGDEVFVRGDWSGDVDTYAIYRLGREYRDPDTDEMLGQEIRRLGLAEIIANEGGDLRRALVRRSNAELEAGDRLMERQATVLDTQFFPQPPDEQVEGRILALLDQDSMASQYDTVVLDLGERDGVAEGDLLRAYEADRSMQDPVTDEQVSLPGNETATLMVYRRFEKLSYAIILTSLRPTRAGFAVRNP